jgi:hypothetical protein
MSACRWKSRTRSSLVAAAALVLLLLAGCTEDSPDPEPTGSQGPEVVVDWSERPTEPLRLAGGFTAVGCPGDAPFLCISKDGVTVGLVEYFSFPAPDEPAAKGLDDVIEEDYGSFTSDREVLCPAGFEVRTVDPAAADVGGAGGMRSEYSVVDAAGETVERYVKYWAVAAGQVHLLSAEAQGENSCSPAEGEVFSSSLLTEFEQAFRTVAEGSRFPEAS